MGIFVVLLVGCSGCAAYTIRHNRPKSHQLSDVDPEASGVDIDRFYFPTDEGLREFQQILLRELGLTKVPDLSKVKNRILRILIWLFSRKWPRMFRSESCTGRG